MFHPIEPQDNSSELQAHPHRLTLNGLPDGLAFPPLCASCGSGQAGTIQVAKVFREDDSDGPTRYVVRAASVPFCSPCIAAHRAAEVRPSLADNLVSSFVGLNMLGAVFPALGAAFLLWLALGDAAHGRGTRFLVELGLGAFFALIAWAQGGSVWRENARFRVPPQTEVTKAFDFSDDVSPVFEPARFVCTIRDGAFAEAFGRLHAGRLYHSGSGAAAAQRGRARRWTWIVGGVLAVFALWALAKDMFG